MATFPPDSGTGDHLDPPPDASTAFEELTPYLTNPRRYNRVRRIFSPFPVLTHTFHAYLLVLSVDTYLQDLDHLAQQ